MKNIAFPGLKLLKGIAVAHGDKFIIGFLTIRLTAGFFIGFLSGCALRLSGIRCAAFLSAAGSNGRNLALIHFRHDPVEMHALKIAGCFLLTVRNTLQPGFCQHLVFRFGCIDLRLIDNLLVSVLILFNFRFRHRNKNRGRVSITECLVIVISVLNGFLDMAVRIGNQCAETTEPVPEDGIIRIAAGILAAALIEVDGAIPFGIYLILIIETLIKHEAGTLQGFSGFMVILLQLHVIGGCKVLLMTVHLKLDATTAALRYRIACQRSKVVSW